MHFTELDVETHPKGQSLYGALGAPGVPVLVVDGEPIVGMDVRGWIRALAASEPVEHAPAPKDDPTGA